MRHKSAPTQRYHGDGWDNGDAKAVRSVHVAVWLPAEEVADATEQEERAEQRNDAHLLLTQQCRQHELTAAV